MMTTMTTLRVMMKGHPIIQSDHLDELYSLIGIEEGKRLSLSMQLLGGHCQLLGKLGLMSVSG